MCGLYVLSPCDITFYAFPLLKLHCYLNMPSCGTHKIFNFPFGTNGKLISFKCPNTLTHDCIIIIRFRRFNHDYIRPWLSREMPKTKVTKIVNLYHSLSEQDALKSAGSSAKLNSMVNGYVCHNYVPPPKVRGWMSGVGTVGVHR